MTIHCVGQVTLHSRAHEVLADEEVQRNDRIVLEQQPFGSGQQLLPLFFSDPGRCLS